MKYLIPLITFLLIGCNSEEVKSPPVSEVSWERVSLTVFQPKCVACHGNLGGVNLESYAQAKSVGDRLCTATTRMPPSSPLEPNLAELVCDWVQSGFPL